MSGQILELLPKVMEDIGKIGIDNRANMGSGGNYTFRGIDDALNHCSPILVKHGVCVTFNVTNKEVKYQERKDRYDNIKIDTCVYLDVEIGFHAPDGSTLKNTLSGEGKDAGDKATNKALSSAMKYGLFFGLVIPVDKRSVDDSDYSAVQPEQAIDAPQAAPRGNRVEGKDVTALHNAWSEVFPDQKSVENAFRLWVQGVAKIKPAHCGDLGHWTQDKLNECYANLDEVQRNV